MHLRLRHLVSQRRFLLVCILSSGRGILSSGRGPAASGCSAAPPFCAEPSSPSAPYDPDSSRATQLLDVPSFRRARWLCWCPMVVSREFFLRLLACLVPPRRLVTFHSGPLEPVLAHSVLAAFPGSRPAPSPPSVRGL
jgi:hypothetical protein